MSTAAAIIQNQSNQRPHHYPMLHQEKENLIQRGINPFISPEIGRYDMTGIDRDVTETMRFSRSFDKDGVNI